MAGCLLSHVLQRPVYSRGGGRLGFEFESQPWQTLVVKTGSDGSTKLHHHTWKIKAPISVVCINIHVGTEHKEQCTVKLTLQICGDCLCLFKIIHIKCRSQFYLKGFQIGLFAFCNWIRSHGTYLTSGNELVNILLEARALEPLPDFSYLFGHT